MQFNRKLELATDLYQLSMGNVYFEEGKCDQIAVFDAFIRNNPFNGGYTVAAGLEQIIEYIKGLSFDDEDIAQLRVNHPEFTPGFLDYLRHLKFTGEIYAVPEGTIVFPHEPMIRVKAPLIQAQLVETTILSILNHQTLIATNASRIAEEAKGDVIMEFGMRRAHGTEAGYFGARAAFIGGFNGSSVVETEPMLGRPSMGTMAHSFIQSHASEEEAFEAYVKYNPQNATLLVDTYNTLEQGMPNAIKVLSKAKAEGHLTGVYGIRIDSGDLAYQTAEARKMLDAAGLSDAIICASSDLDEYLIKDLKAQGAQVNSWGIGTKLITAYDCPSLGGVYKMAEIDGKPKIKVSGDPWKITNPGCKQVYRIYGRSNDMALAGSHVFRGESYNEDEPLTIFHPVHTWKKRCITDYYLRPLLQPIFKNGELVYETPSLQAIKEYHAQEKARLWPTFKRIINPHVYHVDLSEPLWNLRHDLLEEVK